MTTTNLLPTGTHYPQIPQPTVIDVETAFERRVRVTLDFQADMPLDFWNQYVAERQNRVHVAKSADDFAPVADLPVPQGHAEVIELPTRTTPRAKVTDEQVSEWLLALGRPTTPDDVDEGAMPGIAAAATRYAIAHRNDGFEFLADMAAKSAKRPLSAGMVKGVLNCWRSQLLKAQPKPAALVAEVSDGMFYVGTEIYKVQAGHHNGGHQYAKRLIVHDDHGDFEFESGGISKVRAAVADGTGRKMTLEEAKSFGKLYGWCCVCGTILENEKSIKAGIGPVCATKGW